LVRVLEPWTPLHGVKDESCTRAAPFI